MSHLYWKIYQQVKEIYQFLQISLQNLNQDIFNQNIIDLMKSISGATNTWCKKNYLC